jgi:hypothetical protein
MFMLTQLRTELVEGRQDVRDRRVRADQLDAQPVKTTNVMKPGNAASRPHTPCPKALSPRFQFLI